ncbi:Flp pilus assembly protein CpaB [Luteimonas sp. e5]
MQKPKISRNLLYIIGAVVLAGIASMLAMTYVQKTVAEKTRDDTVTVDVAVPNDDLPAGTVLTAEMLSLRSVPADLVPSNALTPENYDRFTGRMLRADIRGGVPISSGALVPLYETFSSLIPEGKVAYNLSVDENNSISGMVAPGDWIDIFFLKDGSAGADDRRGARLFPLLQKIRVLATGVKVRDAVHGSGSDEEQDGYSTLTLELDQYQAKQLAVASKAGALRVLLRKLDDDSPGTANGLTERDLLHSLGEGMPGRSAGSRAVRSVEFIIGSSKG